MQAQTGTEACEARSVAFAYENGGGECRNSRRSVLPVECGLAHDRVSGIMLLRMQAESEALQAAVGEAHLRIGCVEDHDNVLVDAVVSAVGIQLHHDQARNLAWAGVEESEVLLNLPQRGHAEQT